MINTEESDRNRQVYEFLLERIKDGSILDYATIGEYTFGGETEYARTIAEEEGYLTEDLDTAINIGQNTFSNKVKELDYSFLKYKNGTPENIINLMTPEEIKKIEADRKKYTIV